MLGTSNTLGFESQKKKKKKRKKKEKNKRLCHKGTLGITLDNDLVGHIDLLQF
jgi:hypothetical protein